MLNQLAEGKVDPTGILPQNAKQWHIESSGYGRTAAAADGVEGAAAVAGTGIVSAVEGKVWVLPSAVVDAKAFEVTCTPAAAASLSERAGACEQGTRDGASLTRNLYKHRCRDI